MTIPPVLGSVLLGAALGAAYSLALRLLGAPT